MQRVLIEMRNNLAGHMLLSRLNIDGFVVGDRHLYDGVARMMRAFGEG